MYGDVLGEKQERSFGKCKQRSKHQDTTQNVARHLGNNCDVKTINTNHQSPTNLIHTDPHTKKWIASTKVVNFCYQLKLHWIIFEVVCVVCAYIGAVESIS